MTVYLHCVFYTVFGVKLPRAEVWIARRSDMETILVEAHETATTAAALVPRVMKNDRFKAKLQALEALRAISDAAIAAPALRKGLTEKSNFLVAKAASIIGESGFSDLLPDVLAALDRHFESKTDGDPGCRAKRALAQALKDLDHHDAAPFLRGLECIQREPVWGGTADVAGALRGTCAQALVACDIDPTTLLERLIDRFFDEDKTVRVEVACAIAQLGRPESVLLLRLKALGGDREPEVVGQCLLSLLDLAPDDSIPFVARFLSVDDDDLRFEAVSALAQAKLPQAFHRLEVFWSGAVTLDLRLATLGALAASPVPDAGVFLADVVASQQRHLAEAALAALASSRFARDMRENVRATVAASGNDTLRRAFAVHFPD